MSKKVESRWQNTLNEWVENVFTWFDIVESTQEYDHVIIKFEDHHQDFLVWVIEDIGEKFVGQVVNCEPNQESLWVKNFVTNYSDLKVGGFVEISESPLHPINEIRYPIAEILFLKKNPSAKATVTEKGGTYE